MTKLWEENKWIFTPDGSLLDIYVQNVNLSDWLTLIDFLNQNYTLKYSPTSENEDNTQIDKNYIQTLLLDTTGELECKTVFINLDNLTLNCHFFLEDQIEFDANPKEFQSEKEFISVVNFMKAISGLLQKDIILTAESSIEYPLIIINSKTNFLKFTTEQELKNQYDNSKTLFGTLKGKFIFTLMNILPKLRETKFKTFLTNYVIMLTGATKPHVATKHKNY